MKPWTSHTKPTAPSKPIPLMICPKNIPKLNLQKYQGLLNVEVKCKCSVDSTVLSLSQFIDNVNLDPIEDSKVLSDTFKCHLHLKPFSHYCKLCHAHSCEDCKAKHHLHQMIPLCPIDYIFKENFFEEAKEKNRKLVKALLNRIDTEMHNLKEMKIDIERIHKANEQINEDLALLYQSISKTVSAFKEYPSYPLLSLQTIVPNTKEYKQTEKSIEREYSYLRRFFLRNHVLKQASSTESIATLKGVRVQCLIQLRDGRLALGSHNGIIHLWSLSDLSIKTLIGHKTYIFGLVELKDGRLASFCFYDTIKLWNTSTNECITTLLSDDVNHLITNLYQLPDDRLVTFKRNGTLNLWDVSTNEFIALPNEHSDDIQAIFQLRDGKLASVSKDYSIKLWNYAFEECIATLIGHTNKILNIIQLSDGRLVSKSMDLTIRIWSAASFQLITSFPQLRIDNIFIIELFNGRMISWTSHDETILLWDTSTFQVTTRLSGPNLCVNNTLLLSDGRLAFSSYNTIVIWDTAGNNKPGFTLKEHKQPISCLIQLRDGRLASYSENKLFKIWDVCYIDH